jgi:hypothetical protein
LSLWQGKRQEARGKSEEGLGDFTFLYTVSVNQKVFPKERFLRNANAIATDEAGINNKIR